MRRALLASIAWCAMAMPANAQWAVIDPAHIAQSVYNHGEAIVQWGTQHANTARQISGDIQRLQMLVATFESLTRVTDLGTAIGFLSTLGIRMPLGVSPYAVQGLMNGTGGPSGMLSNVSGLFSGSLAANRVFETPGETWMQEQVNQQGMALSGIQAVALQLYQSAADRIPLLQNLQDRINDAPDPSEREALIARFAAEQNYAAQQQQQVSSLGIFAQAQTALGEQRQQERAQQSYVEFRADAMRRGYTQ